MSRCGLSCYTTYIMLKLEWRASLFHGAPWGGKASPAPRPLVRASSTCACGVCLGTSLQLPLPDLSPPHPAPLPDLSPPLLTLLPSSGQWGRWSALTGTQKPGAERGTTRGLSSTSPPFSDEKPEARAGTKSHFLSTYCAPGSVLHKHPHILSSQPPGMCGLF